LGCEWDEIQKILVRIAPFLEGREEFDGLTRTVPSFSAAFNDSGRDRGGGTLIFVVAFPIDGGEFSLYQFDLLFDVEFRNPRLQNFSWGRVWQHRDERPEGMWLGSTSDEASSVSGPRGTVFSGKMASPVTKSQATVELLEKLRFVESVLMSPPGCSSGATCPSP